MLSPLLFWREVHAVGRLVIQRFTSRGQIRKHWAILTSFIVATWLPQLYPSSIQECGVRRTCSHFCHPLLVSLSFISSTVKKRIKLKDTASLLPLNLVSQSPKKMGRREWSSEMPIRDQAFIFIFSCNLPNEEVLQTHLRARTLEPNCPAVPPISPVNLGKLTFSFSSLLCKLGW